MVQQQTSVPVAGYSNYKLVCVLDSGEDKDIYFVVKQNCNHHLWIGGHFQAHRPALDLKGSSKYISIGLLGLESQSRTFTGSFLGSFLG